jgi:hypothetical protein
MTAHTKLKPLSRDDILGVQDRRVEVVEVPEWGGTVRVRGLSGSARDRYESGMVKYDTNDKGVPVVVGMNSDNVRARLVAISIVDENDRPMFTEMDVSALGERSAAALERVFDAARRLSGLSERDVEALKNGLKADQNGSTGSD